MHNWSLQFHLEMADEITEEEDETTLSPFNDDKNSQFRLSIHASAAKIQPDKVVRWCHV